MVKNELSKGIDIELGEEMAEGQYANMVVIAHSTSEFVLDFVRIMPGLPKARVKSRIVLGSAFRSRLLVRAEDRSVRALSLIRSLGRGVFIRSFSRQGKHRKESFVGTIAFARLRAAGFVTGRSVVTVRFRDSYSIGKQPAGCRRNNPVVWQRRSECETDFPTPV